MIRSLSRRENIKWRTTLCADKIIEAIEIVYNIRFFSSSFIRFFNYTIKENMTQIIQILDARYIDRQTLLKLLKKQFEEENFIIDVCEWFLRSCFWC